MPTAVSPLEIARRERGLTQVDVAQRAGISRETVSNIECGGLPRVRTALAIARVLETDLDSILPQAAA